MKIRHHLWELWQYRDLSRNLVVRDLKVRYNSSVLGVAWSWLSPLLMMIVILIQLFPYDFPSALIDIFESLLFPTNSQLGS